MSSMHNTHKARHAATVWVLWSTLFGLVVGTGCDDAEPEDELALRMDDHFFGAMTARDALVAGDDVRARRALAELAELDVTVYPASWADPVEAFRATCARLSKADSRLDVALAVGQLANACARCHRAVDAHPALEPSTRWPAGDDASSHMLRHQWAADRMWEGLMVPDSALWVSGAEALADAPLTPRASASKRAVAPSVSDLARKVHTIGEHSSAATTPAQRAQLYAELLVTCASCHEQLAVTPEEP